MFDSFLDVTVYETDNARISVTVRVDVNVKVCLTVGFMLSLV